MTEYSWNYAEGVELKDFGLDSLCYGVMNALVGQ